MILTGLYEQLLASPAVTAILAPTPSTNPQATGVYFSLAAKLAPRPYIVIHIVHAPPAAGTLDLTTALIDARLQFDSYADDAITARKLSRAVRDLFKDFSGALPDGTTISFTELNTDMDDQFEVGGEGYLYRSLIDMSAFYTEAA